MEFNSNLFKLMSYQREKRNLNCVLLSTVTKSGLPGKETFSSYQSPLSKKRGICREYCTTEVSHPGLSPWVIAGNRGDRQKATKIIDQNF